MVRGRCGLMASYFARHEREVLAGDDSHQHRSLANRQIASFEGEQWAQVDFSSSIG